jgi:predicted unusual protein kinase regulating ubiquinone biosynthesis (AarF/ABC1/UbiB family)
MGFSLKPAHLSRYKDIAHLFIKYGRGDLLKGSDFEETMNGNGRGGNTAPAPTPQAKELATDLEKMGPVFVKIGQLLSTRPDVLPIQYVEALARLQDHVEPFSQEEVEQIVEQELGMRLTRAFASFDPKPISAASLGQVHRATMRDGRAVAVKVQRPNIREKMIDDLSSLNEIAEFLDHHTEIGGRYQFVPMLEEFRKTLMRELDYRLEAQNLSTLADNLREFPRILVPRPINDYTTSRVLTMDYVTGHKITALSPVVKTEIDGKGLAEELFRAYLKQILIDGFFHADPHPGNILLTEDSRIALIDLGMVGSLTPTVQEHLLRILIAVSDGRAEEASQQLVSISEKREDADEQQFSKQVADLVSRNQRMTLQQISVGKVMMELNKIAADSGIRAPSELATLGKTLLNLDEVGSTLNPDFNPNESVRRNATSMLQRRMLKTFTPGNLYTSMLEAKELVQHLPGKVSKILTNLANNDLEVKVDAIDEVKLMAGFQKVANRITVGLILAALIVGAAMLMRVDTSWHIFGYPGLAMLFFMLAAAGGIWLVLHVLLKDEHA